MNEAIQSRRPFQHPRLFRDVVRLTDDGPPLVDLLQPWQRVDFHAIDNAWADLAGRSPLSPNTTGLITGSIASKISPLRRAYIERPRGHSKTSDTAVQITWILIAARHAVSGLAAAADREQASLIHRAIQRLADTNDELCRDLRFIEHEVKNKVTGSRLEVISSDVQSSYGALPDFVVCDELCHWSHPDLWHSLLSSAAKRPNCVLTVLTNAGTGRGWQWDVREHARVSPTWHFSSLQGPQAPWITAEWLEEQRALLPPSVFDRLWMNAWHHSDGELVTLGEAEACRDEQLQYQSAGRPDRVYVAAIDYAEKHDFTVGCVCHRDGDFIIVDRMDVVRPTPTRPTPVQWVEDWIADVAANFPRVRFVLDEHQLLHTIQRFANRYELRRFDFGGGIGNHKLTMNLRQLLIHRHIRWYANCGTVESPHGRDDLETELASLLLRESKQGRVRLDHHRDGIHHDDRAFTLGVAALELCDTLPIETTFLDITQPATDGGFLW
ncbi:MAG: terminase large subunit [Planctomycetaceae bacterium]